MTSYLCHFHVTNGVFITLDMDLKTEHYGKHILTEACRMLADKLGIVFVYHEVKT